MLGYKFLGRNERGNLSISNCDCVELAKKYGTPLYVMDEDEIRKRCKNIKSNHMDKYKGFAVYASKAFLNKEMCRIIESEKLGLDVVSGGELYTAHSVNFPMEKIIFHGNNKSYEELEMAVDYGVGTIALDNFLEIKNLENILDNRNKKINVIIRITPGIDCDTNEYIKTGQIDSKFGFSLCDGSALRAVEKVINCNNFIFEGLSAHIGSQITENGVYEKEVKVLAKFANNIGKEFNCEVKKLDVGGGFGIFYKEGDKRHDISYYTNLINETVIKEFEKYNMKKPMVIIEPGRWIVGEAGVTLYTVGSIKEIKGIRKYVNVDGGMTDNPRQALYKAQYNAVIANKKENTKRETVTIAGKCCESGDILIKNTQLQMVNSGDIVAILSTGAYNYSMSSNYNRIRKPAVVMVKDNSDRLILKRQSYEEILRDDI
ncbi:diaminopimelate decarboxylase [Clostridium sp. JNZ X4-2]